MNVTITLTTEQIAQFIQQMPPEEKLEVLRELSNQDWSDRGAQFRYGEAKVRQLCAERGRNWDVMDEDERLQFIDALIHEEPKCIR